MLEHHATREQNLSGSVSGSNPPPVERAPLEIVQRDAAGPPFLLTPAEVAARLGYRGVKPAKRVYDLPIRQTRRTPRRIMYHPDDVEEYISKRRERT